MTASSFVSLLDSRSLKPQRNAQGWMARCPAHEDRRASLSVSEGQDGRILLRCHAGCETENICAALGIKVADLFPEATSARSSSSNGRKDKSKAPDGASNGKAAVFRARIGGLSAARADHPYLVRKGIGPHDALQDEDLLVLSLVDEDGEIHGLQEIAPDKRFGRGQSARDKNFPAGSKTRGCFFAIGDLARPGVLLLAEGFATGASLHESTGFPVLCAMSCGNLEPVALAAKRKWPGARLVVCADNDTSGKRNPGLEDGRKGAAAVGGCLCFPTFAGDENGKDFNDLHLLHGKGVVRDLVEAALSSKVEAAPLDCGEEIKRLATLTRLQYEQERKDAALRVGVRPGALDKLVDESRGKTDDKPGCLVEYEEPEAWPDKVDGAALLEEIRDCFLRHLVCRTKPPRS